MCTYLHMKYTDLVYNYYRMCYMYIAIYAYVTRIMSIMPDCLCKNSPC